MKRIYLFAALALIWSNYAFCAEELVFKDDFEEPPKPAVINSFSADPELLTAGESTTLTWATAHATSCTPSGGAGGWDLLPIKLSEGSAQIDITTADAFNFTLTCEGEVGVPAIAEVIVTSLPPVVITAFSADPVNIFEGESTTLSWTTQDAAICIPTGGAGGWDSTEIALPAGSAAVEIADAGTYTFKLTCVGLGGDSVIEEVVVEVTAIAPVAITMFDATPASITKGGSTTIRWTTENAVSCTPSGDVADWEAVAITLPNGNTEISISTTGNLTFTLTCNGSTGDSASDSTVVTVTEPQVNNCTTPPLIGTKWQWADFWDEAFPLPTYSNRLVDIYRFGYAAIEFYTGSVVDHGLLVSVGTTYTGGTRLGAVTKCPGDFNAPPECEHSWGLGGGIEWATDGLEGACQLEPNTTYYLNITFTDGFDNTQSTCEESPCYAKMQAVNRD